MIVEDGGIVLTDIIFLLLLEWNWKFHWISDWLVLQDIVLTSHIQNAMAYSCMLLQFWYVLWNSFFHLPVASLFHLSV